MIWGARNSRRSRQKFRSLGLLGITISTLLLPIAGITPTIAAPLASTSQPDLIVNSPEDTVLPDDHLTLREAIELVNGDLSYDRLSDVEKRQIPSPQRLQEQDSTRPLRIGFHLPVGHTIIALQQALPDLTQAVTIDGTTQPGYNPQQILFAQNDQIRQPIVAITPAPGIEILRGLTLTADNITIRGLSLYGFTSQHGLTESTPPADLFISHVAPPPDIRQQPIPASDAPFHRKDIPPKNILIENNWLGIRPDRSFPSVASAFGVSLFNSQGAIVRNNWIANHDGSAIITSVNATNTQIISNLITSNGLAGMPDAIRLEGNVDRIEIEHNHICGNDGSGVYLFKPNGAVTIAENSIVYNSRRLRRAAIYLMGNHHRVTDNTIAHQTAAGVVVAAAPPSLGNQIAHNRFSHLEGLSIDLNSNHNTDVSDYQQGDGLNPPRNSPNRRQETGNAAINTPTFDTRYVPLSDREAVTISGQADPGSTIELYRVSEPLRVGAIDAGPLDQPLLTVPSQADGHFSATLPDNLSPGTQLSAIAHHPQYGTSEPALNATLGATPVAIAAPKPEPPPACVSPPAPPTTVPPEIVEVPPPAPIRIQVPKTVHFALDQSSLSPRSTQILDRVAAVLKQYPTLIIELQGHTDPRASDAYNLALGKRRALAVRNYLLRQGIDPSRMTIRSLGERQPISNGVSKLDYARDRRTEILYKDSRNLAVIVQEDDLQIEP